MTSQPWLAEYLEQGAQEPGPYALDAASADAARRLRGLLADADGWAEPPAGLLGQIFAGIDRERATPTVADGRRRQIRARRTVRAGAAALLAAAAVVIGIVVTRGPATTDVVLDVSKLPPSPPGFYYQAWMKGPHGLVTIGTFHMRGGPRTVELWSAVSLADYPVITVTREPEDGNPASSGQVVLTSRHP